MKCHICNLNSKETYIWNSSKLEYTKNFEGNIYFCQQCSLKNNIYFSSDFLFVHFDKKYDDYFLTISFEGSKIFAAYTICENDKDKELSKIEIKNIISIEYLYEVKKELENLTLFG